MKNRNSEKERDHTLPVLGELVAEGLDVPFPQRVGARAKVAERPDCKDEAGPRQGHNPPSHPLSELAEVICGGHIFEHPTVGDVERGIARFAQVADDVVRVDIDHEPREENDHANDELGAG